MEIDHGFPDNPYNKHTWIAGNPQIGKDVWIGAFCLIDALYAPLKIGKGTDISSGVQILTHSTVKRCLSERRFNNIEAKVVEIEEFCFIGTNAVILMGAKIGHHSVVAAGAVVSQGMNIPPYSIVAGVPAKIIGSSKKYLKNINQISISVVIPAYNEQFTIKEVVKNALDNLSRITTDFEIVLVNDGSTDDTEKIINKLALEYKKVKAVHHKKNKGFTGAIKTSFKSATKHLVFLAPADGQFDFKQLKKFIDAIAGFDVAIGYRSKNDEAFSRKLNSKIFHYLCKVLLGISLKEISTVSLWRKPVIDLLITKSSDRSAMFLPEIIHKALLNKYKFIEVPITWQKRKGGQAKGANPTVILKTLMEMVQLWIGEKLPNSK